MTTLNTCIKNIDAESWRLFKVEAAKHDMQLGEFFSKIVQDHAVREGQNNWDFVLNRKRSLTKRQVEELRKNSREFRKGFNFRNASS